MVNQPTVLERAFNLAKSGACSSIEDLRRCLRLEGYSHLQIIGSSLVKQLRDLIRESREPTIPDPKSQERAADVMGTVAQVKPISRGKSEGIVAKDGNVKRARELGLRTRKAPAQKTSSR